MTMDMTQPAPDKREAKVWRAKEVLVPAGKSHTFQMQHKVPVKLVEFQCPAPFLVASVAIGRMLHNAPPPGSKEKPTWEGLGVPAGTIVTTTILNTAPEMSLGKTKDFKGNETITNNATSALGFTGGWWYYSEGAGPPAHSAAAGAGPQVVAEPVAVAAGPGQVIIPPREGQTAQVVTIIAPNGGTPVAPGEPPPLPPLPGNQQAYVFGGSTVTGSPPSSQPPPPAALVNPPAGAPVQATVNQATTSVPTNTTSTPYGGPQAGRLPPPLPTEYAAPRPVMPPTPEPAWTPIQVHNSGLTPTMQYQRKDGVLDASPPVVGPDHHNPNRKQPAPQGSAYSPTDVEAPPGTMAILAGREDGRRWLFAIDGGVIRPQEAPALMGTFDRAMSLENARAGMSELIYLMDPEDIQILKDLINTGNFPREPGRVTKMIDLRKRIAERVNTP